jgi:hypothetical protein
MLRDMAAQKDGLSRGQLRGMRAVREKRSEAAEAKFEAQLAEQEGLAYDREE